MKNNSKLIVLFTFSILVLSTTITSANFLNKSKSIEEEVPTMGVKSEDNIANWTVMFYLCCENHASYEAEKRIQNLTKIGSSNDLHLVALKDQDQNGDSRLYYIEKNNPVNLNPVYGWPNEVDMGDPNTLYQFIDLVKENYPAEHYAMYLLSDMGSGWQGICHDSRNPNNGLPLMSIPMFADVFKKVTDNGSNKFDVLILSPCVSGMTEVAYELSPYIKYVVFSEEHMLEELDKGPEYILKYKACTQNLKNDIGMSPEDFANSFVKSYVPTDFPMWALYAYMVLVKKGEYSPIIEKLSDILTKMFNSLPNPEFHIVTIKTTLSAIKLDRLEKLRKAVDNLSSILLLYQDDSDVKNTVSTAREDVREYGKFYVKNRKTSLYYLNFPMEKLAFDSFVDLYDLVDLINQSTSKQAVKDACQEVMTKIKETVIKNSALPDDPSHGLSIYFPKNEDLYNRYIWEGKITYPYETLSFTKDAHWDEFLKTYLKD